MINKELLINRICELSEEKGISTTQALIQSKAGKDFISNIKKGQTPSIEKVVLLSIYFNVSIDYLLGEINHLQKEKLPQFGELSEDEIQLLTLFRSAQSDTRFAVIHMLMTEKKSTYSNEIGFIG